jgi:predicted enzyme related to lactoylglutathione lyase
MANTIVWADIPVTDMDRARKFYAAVLQVGIEMMPGSDDVALLPGDPMGGDVSGDLVKSESNAPGAGGIAIYLDSKGDPEGMISRAVAAGGQVAMPVSDMGEMVGFIGFFIDSEGNRIGVHAPPKQD